MKRIASSVKLFFTLQIERWPLTTIRNLCLLLLFCCFSLQTRAQAELRADSNHVETGNPFVLHLRLPVTFGKPDSLKFDTWETVLSTQNILNETAWQTDGPFYNKTITTLFFDEDSLQLPPLSIALPNGDTAYSNPLLIVVTATPSPDDLNDMAYIKDIHREPTYWTDYWPWILGSLLVLALLGWLFWMAKRKSRARIQSRSIEIPAHELALKKLNILANKGLIVKGLIKEHYSELTFLVREYLEKGFGIPALESTTEETLGYLKKQAFPQEMAERLQTLLEQADLAKFAKIIPPESFHTEALEDTKQIILETSPPINPLPIT